MCNFDIPWVGKCEKPEVEDGFCAEHLGEKCSICGEQATHSCSSAGTLICGYKLCSNPYCKLQHYYQMGCVSFSTIRLMEEMLKIPDSDKAVLLTGFMSSSIKTFDGKYTFGLAYKRDGEYYCSSISMNDDKEKVNKFISIMFFNNNEKVYQTTERIPFNEGLVSKQFIENIVAKNNILKFSDVPSAHISHM